VVPSIWTTSGDRTVGREFRVPRLPGVQLLDPALIEQVLGRQEADHFLAEQEFGRVLPWESLQQAALNTRTSDLVAVLPRPRAVGQTGSLPERAFCMDMLVDSWESRPCR
jgi:hypothetical protein